MLEILQPDRRQDRRLRWFAADAVVALLFLWITVESLRSTAYVTEYGPIEGPSWLLAVSPTFPLFVRRLTPMSAMVGGVLLYLVASAVQGDSNAPLAVPLFAYSVGMTRPVPVSASLVAVTAVVMSIAVFFGPGDPLAMSVPVLITLFAIGWLIAVNVRGNQTRADLLADETEVLRAQSMLIAEQAATDERARIARELHDAVGHAVNVIVMQAGAARLAADNERTSVVLRNIEHVGRSALSDLDHMLGLLHDHEGGGAPLGPARTIEDIVRLVDEMRAGGADVHLHNRCDGSLEDMTNQRTGTAAYRIVQEALTNAIKHAGNATIDVNLSCGSDRLELEVIDDGLGAAAAKRVGGGRGIAGMTERARVLGGELAAAPIPGGGFRVCASIPRNAKATPPRRLGS